MNFDSKSQVSNNNIIISPSTAFLLGVETKMMSFTTLVSLYMNRTIGQKINEKIYNGRVSTISGLQVAENKKCPGNTA